MKVILLNGSPHPNGCTFTALSEVERVLHAEGIETELLQLGALPVRGCTGCGACAKRDGFCIFDDDIVNCYIEKVREADGFIVGSPVYYASPNGSLISLLDRMFYCNGKTFEGKVGACVVSARRAGTTASLDVLQKYMLISKMPLAPSQYWNMVHGNTPEEVAQDAEGLQTMRTLGRNVAWMLKCIDAGKRAGITFPEAEMPRARTNFIR